MLISASYLHLKALSEEFLSFFLFLKFIIIIVTLRVVKIVVFVRPCE